MNFIIYFNENIVKIYDKKTLNWFIIYKYNSIKL